jgi:hypothetical protein
MLRTTVGVDTAACGINAQQKTIVPAMISVLRILFATEIEIRRFTS